MGQTTGSYLPQMLIASPPASRCEPGLFTLVLLLRDTGTEPFAVVHPCPDVRTFCNLDPVTPRSASVGNTLAL